MAHSRWPKRPQHKVKGVWANENALASAGTGWSPRVVHFSTATHNRYLDRCGECLVRLEDRLDSGWIPVETSPTSGSMKNEPLGLALSFNSEGVNVRQTLFLDSVVFLDQSCTIYDTLRKTLEIDRIATPSLRVFYQVGFAEDQVDAAERALLEMNLCEVNANLLNAMGGENFAVQLTTVTRDRSQIQQLGAQLRRRFQAVVVRQERQHTVDSRLFAQARSLGKKQADAIVGSSN